MTTAGAIIMLVSVGTVTSLFSWCVWKVLTTPSASEHVHAVELDTPDMHREP
jgi:hypothetical protein